MLSSLPPVAVRSLLSHLPKLLQAIVKNLTGNISVGSSVTLTGDPDALIIFLQTGEGATFYITIQDWLGSQLQSIKTEFPTHPTPRSVVPVKVAKIVVKIVEMLGYEVQLDSTTTTTKCFMDLKFHTTKHQATVNIRLFSDSSNHGKKSARRMLTLVIPKPDVSSRCCLSTDACNLSQGHASCKYKLQDEEGYNFKAKGKGDEFIVSEDEPVHKLFRLLYQLIVKNDLGESGSWMKLERRFREAGQYCELLHWYGF
jgi:hypothetical protein